MELNFELNHEDLYDTKLLDSFCDKLIESIRTDIRAELIPAKYPMLEQGLLNAQWIAWTKKPKTIDIEGLIDIILKCIVWRKRRYRYQIYIRTDVKVPQTVNTSFEQVARFLDKGNLISKHSTMFSRVFNEYEKHIEDYWTSYKEFGYILDDNTSKGE